eukprot:4450562-Amphidinium_carterae.1
MENTSACKCPARREQDSKSTEKLLLFWVKEGLLLLLWDGHPRRHGPSSLLVRQDKCPRSGGNETTH